jgi:excisionase family DNA binding protein
MTAKPKQRHRHVPKPPPDDYGRLLTIPAVAQILDCSRQKIYQLAKSERLHMVKFGSSSRITDASVRKLMSNLPRAEIKGNYG